MQFQKKKSSTALKKIMLHLSVTFKVVTDFGSDHKRHYEKEGSYEGFVGNYL